MRSSSSSCPHHEIFEELAALAAVGELSALEQERLRHHLGECPHCTEMYKTFADIASNDFGVVAGEGEPSEPIVLSPAEDAETREELQRLRVRLKLHRTRVPGEESAPLVNAEANQNVPRQPAILANYRHAGFGIAATLLLALAVGGGMALWRSERTASAERARSRELQLAVDALKQDKRTERVVSDTPVVRSLEESQKARDVLQKSLAASEAKNQELLAREKTSEEKVAEAIAMAEQLRMQLETKDADRERLTKLQRESDARLQEALAELDQARQVVQTAAKSQAHDDVSLEAFEQSVAKTGGAPISPTEVEARSLFGARDLHIVDVYDVTGDGKTKRTYGRVYYVEKRLLVFYAFDLEDRQNHKRGVFQAWGYREANLGKPLSLGHFTMDDNASGRWVLTVNRPDVLSHIDAVFVTVEPDSGSTAPRGKKVLYANLVGPANHP
jgi:hypothetical protein